MTDPSPEPTVSIEMIAKQRMPLAPDQHLVPQAYPAICPTYTRNILWTIPSRISQATTLLPIYFFALGLGSNAHAEL